MKRWLFGLIIGSVSAGLVVAFAFLFRSWWVFPVGVVLPAALILVEGVPMVFKKKEELPSFSVAQIQDEAYRRGAADASHNITLAVVQALGLRVQSPQLDHQDAPVQPEQPPPAPSPAVLPPSGSGPVCARCGHGRDAHVPLSEKMCFAPGCAGCKGFTLKKGVFG